MHDLKWKSVRGRNAWVISGLLLFSMVAAANTISFPVQLDPSIPNGYVLATYVHGADTFSDEESNTTGANFARAGVFNLVSLASGQGGGAFASLTHGAVGIDSVGQTNGGSEIAEAILLVNVQLTGAGLNTLNFTVNGSSAFDGCNVFACGNTLMSGVSVYSSGAGIQASITGNGCEGLAGAGCKGLPLPETLSLSFDSTAQPNIYQFQFYLTGISDAFAGIFAQHTGLISLDLHSGVTMDSGSGFLSQPGDPNIGGPTGVPEPSSLMLLGSGLAGLVGVMRRKLHR